MQTDANSAGWDSKENKMVPSIHSLFFCAGSKEPLTSAPSVRRNEKSRVFKGKKCPTKIRWLHATWRVNLDSIDKIQQRQRKNGLHTSRMCGVPFSKVWSTNRIGMGNRTNLRAANPALLKYLPVPGCTSFRSFLCPLPKVSAQLSFFLCLVFVVALAVQLGIFLHCPDFDRSVTVDPLFFFRCSFPFTASQFNSIRLSLFFLFATDTTDIENEKVQVQPQSF